MKTRYKVTDIQGGIFGEYYNDKGGATIEQLREMAVGWLHVDDRDNENSPVEDQWSVEQIAAFWEIEITPIPLKDELKYVKDRIDWIANWHNKNLTKEQENRLSEALATLENILDEEIQNEIQ